MCMIDHAEWCEWSSSREHTARKTHRCDECYRDIQPGERYRIGVGGQDGSIWSEKQCRHCWAASVWLTEVCGGFLWGGVAEDLREHWDVSPKYRTLWLGRAVVGQQRRWRRRDGELMPVLGRPVYTADLEPHVRRLSVLRAFDAGVAARG